MAAKAKVEVHQFASKLAWKAATWSFIYLWGYLTFSPGWLALPLLLSVIRYQAKAEGKVRLATGQALACAPEREVVGARVSELPAWVFFPDVERVEWVNRVVAQLWPTLTQFITHILTTEVEPLIHASLLERNLGQFKLIHVRLGQIPPRLGGVKCYERQTARDEIILDLDVTWAGESDIQVSLRGMQASVMDLYLHGNLRIVFKPLLQRLPLVGGMQMYFLHNPTLDFGVGGMANVADLPGISSLIRRLIMEQIERFVVLPNKLTVPFSPEVPMQAFKCPQLKGVLRITLVEARDLMKMDLIGDSDPFCNLSVGCQHWQSSVVKNSLEPVWKEDWEAVVEEAMDQTLDLDMWDKDHVGADEFMGRANIPISKLTDHGKTDQWVELEEATSGQVRIQSLWMPIVPRREGTKTVLQVYVDSCRLLPSVRGRQPDPRVELFVVEDQVKETVPIRCNRNPVFEEGFLLLIPGNANQAELKVRVRDSKGSALHSVDEELGSWRFALAKLFTLSEMRIPTQPWRLTCSGTESSITIGLELFCVGEDEKLEERMKRPTFERQDERVDGVQDSEDADGNVGNSGSSQEDPVVQQRRGKRQSLRNLFMKPSPLFNKSHSD